MLAKITFTQKNSRKIQALAKLTKVNSSPTRWTLQYQYQLRVVSGCIDQKFRARFLYKQ